MLNLYLKYTSHTVLFETAKGMKQKAFQYLNQSNYMDL